jgi:hypothetical protein
LPRGPPLCAADRRVYPPGPSAQSNPLSASNGFFAPSVCRSRALPFV